MLNPSDSALNVRFVDKQAVPVSKDGSNVLRMFNTTGKRIVKGVLTEIPGSSTYPDLIPGLNSRGWDERIDCILTREPISDTVEEVTLRMLLLGYNVDTHQQVRRKILPTVNGKMKFKLTLEPGEPPLKSRYFSEDYPFDIGTIVVHDVSPGTAGEKFSGYYTFNHFGDVEVFTNNNTIEFTSLPIPIPIPVPEPVGYGDIRLTTLCTWFNK
jgi:hypothetical protein